MNAEKLLSPTPLESTSTTQAKQLLESWKDREYRAAFVRERVRSSVALQIRGLREQRNHMTQKQLGDAIGKAQTWISVLEDPEYGKMSVATLLSLAQVFDTDLEIKFRPFSRALHELTDQDSEYFSVRSFEQELPDLENAGVLQWIVPDGKWSDILRAAQLLAKTGEPTAIPNMATPSGALETEPEISQLEYAAAANPPLEFEAMKQATSIPVEVHGESRSRKRIRQTRRKETSWRKRKPPKRAISSPSTSDEAKIMNPSMQTAFTFSQASGI
jgi:transcriptional regulator with XRE-family HTH domain